MDLRYFQFCRLDTPYFDVAATTASDDDLEVGTPPAGWRREQDADWCYLHPPGADDLPEQGWKVHVSATLDNAESLLATVAAYCYSHGILFKYIRSIGILARRNSKYGDRTASGKFIAIFPADEAQLAQVLHDLDAAVGGQAGPYILSDLRYADGPLFVRYGGFKRLFARDDNGDLVHCIRDPEGRLVPDQRKPVFRPPPWVELPEVLAPSLEARNRGSLADFPYRPRRALHFSNGGGVYEAVHVESGQPVLMKEARPLAGLDEQGRDAVARLEREHWALDALAGLAAVPAVHTYRRGHEHYFLVRDLVAGRAFTEFVQRHNPLLGSPEALSVDEYTQRVVAVLDAVAGALAAMHDRGVVFGDVHPNNILVGDDGAVAFIDYEAASAVADAEPQRIGAPGFRAPLTYAGVAVDHYGLGCLRLHAFLPATVALPWGPEKLEQLLADVCRLFPVPDDFAAQVRQELGPAPHPHAEPLVATPLWAAPSGQANHTVSTALPSRWACSATPERDDRLYPGDIQQFLLPGGGTSLAYGAAGVLYALAAAGLPPAPDEHVDWLVEHTRDITRPRPGLFDGLAGVAFALDRVGRHDDATDVLDRCLALPLDDLRPNLYEGAPGVGLTLLHFAGVRGDQALLHRAVAVGERIAAAPVTGPSGGLLHGPAGAALFFLRLAEATGDQAWIARAGDALRDDLAVLGWAGGHETARHGAWQVPVIAGGGAGTLMVLHEYVHVRPEFDLAGAYEALKEPLRTRFLPSAGLMAGRAGTMLALATVRGTTPWADALLDRHAVDLGWHAVPHRNQVGMLGELGLRMSCDLGTGSAGTLLALAAADPAGTVRLPFLDVPAYA